MNKKPEILWQEEGVCALGKPSGLPIHRSRKHRGPTLDDFLKAELGQSWATIHRLDQETSGIVLCADAPRWRRNLAKQFEARTIKKEYLAIVHGVPSASWVEERPIGKSSSPNIRIKQGIRKDGQKATTEFELIEALQDVSLVRVRPHTGRHHQIRVHAAASGHPLVGDRLYFPDETIFLESYDNGLTKRVLAAVLLPRLALHACSLTFLHPNYQVPVTVNSPLAADLMTWWREKAEKNLAASVSHPTAKAFDASDNVRTVLPQPLEVETITGIAP